MAKFYTCRKNLGDAFETKLCLQPTVDDKHCSSHAESPNWKNGEYIGTPVWPQ